MFSSKMGSVTLLGDIFYNQRYQEVYIPINHQDALRFISLIEKEEARHNRRLSLNEINAIVTDLTKK